MSARDSDAIDEELTAYLDGELSAEDSAALERRLVGDEYLRTRLATLRRSYDLLDELPEAPHRKSFTQTTIEMVIADVKRSGDKPVTKLNGSGSKDSAEVSQRRWFTMPWALLPLMLAVLMGLGIGLLVSGFKAKRELGMLDLASNLPGLRDAGELRIIEELAKDKELVGYLEEHYRDTLIPAVPKSNSDRQTWVRGLNAIQMTKLDGARELLSKYTPDVRSRLEAIQDQINALPNAQDLNLTARMIGVVLDTLPTSKRQILEDLNTASKISFLKEQLAFRAATFYAADLQGADAEALEEWSNSMLLPSIMANLPFLRRETDAKSALMALYSSRPVEEGFRLENQDGLISDLAGRMSSFPKSLLEALDISDQLFVISTWMIPDGVNSNTRMLEAYERMRRELRDEVDLADPKDIRRLLRDRRRPGGTNRPPR